MLQSVNQDKCINGPFGANSEITCLGSLVLITTEYASLGRLHTHTQKPSNLMHKIIKSHCSEGREQCPSLHPAFGLVMDRSYKLNFFLLWLQISQWRVACLPANSLDSPFFWKISSLKRGSIR